MDKIAISAQALAIPEILEAVLLETHPIEIYKSCLRVCKKWNTLIRTSPLLGVYMTTGLRATPQEVEYDQNNEAPPPKPNPRGNGPEESCAYRLTELGIDIISMYWDRLIMHPRQSETQVDTEYIEHVGRIFDMFLRICDRVQLIYPPAPFSVRFKSEGVGRNWSHGAMDRYEKLIENHGRMLFADSPFKKILRSLAWDACAALTPPFKPCDGKIWRPYTDYSHLGLPHLMCRCRGCRGNREIVIIQFHEEPTSVYYTERRIGTLELEKTKPYSAIVWNGLGPWVY